MAKQKKTAKEHSVLELASLNSCTNELKNIPPVVGIGASAGGLEALEQFFTNVGPASGLAYIVVQHLDPDKKSLLVELLQRLSNVQVLEITDLCKVEANHIYVAPPGFDVTIMQGVLHLLTPPEQHGPHLGIDFFLRSLADDQGSNAVGVILSGMGSDGTLGLRALKEKAGGCFVQTPGNAQFDSMPRSAIAAELADVVAPAAELPDKLVAYFGHPLLSLPTGVQRVVQLESALEKVLILVRAQTGHDFSLYKKSTVYRRIQRRMAIHQVGSVDDYLRHVRNNPVEAELLFKELLIGVTSFFRDPAVWDQLKSDVLPTLLRQYPDGGVLRAWVAACSTGEEAYSLAMVFREAVSKLAGKAEFTLQIFATDLQIDAINRARQGIYSENIRVDVSTERLERFFTKTPGGYRINKDIRSMVVFAQQSIASDPPFGKLSILSCRNLLIYLEPELQQKLLPLFYESLLPDGILILGSAETVGTATDLFTPVGAKTRIFRRLDAAPQPGRGSFPITGPSLTSRIMDSEAFVHTPVAKKLTIQAQADQLLLRKFAPAAALVNAQGDIVYFSGKTGKYLEPAAGKANLNIFAMARSGLAQPLTDLFYRAEREQKAVMLDEIYFELEGAVHLACITVEPLQEPASLKGMLMVIFTDMAVPDVRTRKPRPGKSQPDARSEELMHQLIRAREEHQSTREEMQTSQEELKSANEELQSANEELTTSREELHSINQELQTVNSELQSQVSALSRASDDMENLLNSTDIATLFLDEQLHVRRYTPRTLSVIKLIPSDVGRPITDLVTELQGDGLAADAGQVLKTLMFTEREVQASRNRWFMVRTMPYRTQDNRIEGVVITFTDVSVAKSLEASLRGDRVANNVVAKAKPRRNRTLSKK